MNTTDPTVKLEETIDRLNGYKDSFTTDVEERILLKELRRCCTNIKNYADSNLSGVKQLTNGPEIVDLEKRIDEAEVKVVTLNKIANEGDEEITAINEEIFLLKAKDNVIKEAINGIKEVDETIRTDVTTKKENLETEVTGLHEEDVLIEAKLSNEKDRVTTELTAIDSKIEEINLDGIKDEITELQTEDDRLKELIEDNHAENKELIESLETKADDIDLDAIRKDIIDLKAKDVVLEEDIVTLRTKLDTRIQELKEIDVEILNEIEELENLIESVASNLVISSKTGAADKVPIGLKDGFIDTSWYLD